MCRSTNYTSRPTLPVLSKQNAEVVCGVGWAVGVRWRGEKCGGAIRSSSRWFLMVAPNRAEKRSSCLYARPSHQSTLHPPHFHS